MKKAQKKIRKQPAGKQPKLLPLLAGAVLAAALAVTLLPRLAGTGGNSSPDEAVSVTGADLVLQADAIGAQASFFDYDAGGTTVEVFAVRAADDTVRLALNTCQVCNGSPYAYFLQDGDTFICQNCMNRFASTDVGLVSGGCNPVPVTAETYTWQDGTITIPASFLEGSAYRFTNWKNF